MSRFTVPDGLVLVSRPITGVSRRLWDVRHASSELRVLRACRGRDEAMEAARALSGIDWTRPLDELRADPIARRVAFDLQVHIDRPRRTA